MEYMLLPGNNVQAFHKLDTWTEVKAALQLYGGLGYYWHTESFGWRVITPDTQRGQKNNISDDDVPALIKLAAMMG